MYEKFANWKNLPDESTPITAAALTHIEQGITDVDVTRPGTPAEVELSSRLSATAGSAEGLVQAERAARESALELKADKTAVYTKAETYTRAETGTQITNAITASRPPLYGTGFPNGVVAAPVGTLYSDAVVTNGASLWQKISGTGASGWVVVAGETGRRNIAALLGPKFTTDTPGGGAFIERRGPLVTISLAVKSLGTGAYEELLPRMDGFIKSTNGVAGFGSANGVFTDIGAYGGAGYFQVRQVLAAGVALSAQIQYFTNDSWPATLPGTN